MGKPKRRQTYWREYGKSCARVSVRSGVQGGLGDRQDRDPDHITPIHFWLATSRKTALDWLRVPDQPTPTMGKTLGRYEVLALIGRGGMGAA